MQPQPHSSIPVSTEPHLPQAPVVPTAPRGPNLPSAFERFGHRHLMAETGSFLTRVREAEWIGGEAPYAYAQGNPLKYIDPQGLAPKTCSEILKCLAQDVNDIGMPYSEGNPCHCGTHSPTFKVNPHLMLCVFRKECGSRDGKTIDPDNCIDDKGGGIGQMTPDAVSDLKRWCCNEGVNDPWDGVSVKGKNWCKGARIARNFMTCRGLARYGPPYPAATQQQLLECATCLKKGYPCESCFKYIK